MIYAQDDCRAARGTTTGHRPLILTRSAPRSRAMASAALLCASSLIGATGQAQAQAQEAMFPASPATHTVTGFTMLDYSALTLTDGTDFDLFGIHYMQRVNDWLYVGAGAFAPMVEGNYSGFYGADVTLHAQRTIFGNWFANAGLSLGAAAGGQSNTNISRLSGDGIYGRAYVGVGYAFENFSLGLNYSHVEMPGGQVNSDAVNLFVQMPFSYARGDFRDAGRQLGLQDFDAPRTDNILSFNYTHVSQIDPTARYSGDIGFASLQFSHFLNDNVYAFFGIDIGVSGLMFFNQAQGGLGYRWALSDNVNLYGQVGIGSGGYVTNTYDAGPGLAIYPRATLEYLWGNGFGATASLGYLAAPLGTARSWTVGLGLNYHMSGPRSGRTDRSGADYTLRGVRLNVMGRATSDIDFNGRVTDGLGLVALQADYMLDENWYLAAQVAAGTEAFRGIAGYAEGYIGAGWQTNLTASGRLQAYAQLLYGLNDVGVSPAHEVGGMVYPAIGFSYGLNDRVALYGQIGATISTGQYFGTHTNAFETYTVGLGLSYRFSLPTR